MTKSNVLARAALAVAAIALSACGSHGTVPPSTWAPATSSRVVAPLEVFQAALPNVTGTYNGSFSETEKGKTATGTATMNISQSGSNISGTFSITVNGVTGSLPFSGTVSKYKTGARLRFTVKNPKGRSASAKATVFGKKLKGTAYVAPSGTKPAIYIKYSLLK